jgi:hypothetical protein
VEEDSEEEDDVDDFFEARMYGLTVSADSNPVARVWLCEGEYDGDDLVLGRYLDSGDSGVAYPYFFP